MKAQLKDTPSQWVSINNRSKSRKQQQSIIEMTDDGILVNDASNKSAKPVKTQTQQRKPSVTEPTEETSTPPSTKPSSNRSGDSVPENPLTVTPVESMPPMPE